MAAAPSKFPSVTGRVVVGMCCALMIVRMWDRLRYGGTHAKAPGEPTGRGSIVSSLRRSSTTSAGDARTPGFWGP